MFEQETYIARFELEERMRAAEAFQRMLLEQGRIPDTGKLLLRRARIGLEIIGGLLLGMFAAVMAMLLVFVIFNKVIHI